jgi:hypothetical protein
MTLQCKFKKGIQNRGRPVERVSDTMVTQIRRGATYSYTLQAQSMLQQIMPPVDAVPPRVEPPAAIEKANDLVSDAAPITDVAKTVQEVVATVPDSPPATPEIKIPQMPEIKLPEVQVPKIVQDAKITSPSMPEAKAPQLPEVKVPAPEVPGLPVPEVPSVQSTPAPSAEAVQQAAEAVGSGAAAAIDADVPKEVCYAFAGPTMRIDIDLVLTRACAENEL